MTIPVIDGHTPHSIRARARASSVPIFGVLEAAGVSRNTLWRWENGKNVPQRITVAKITHVLDHVERGGSLERVRAGERFAPDEKAVIRERAKYQKPKELAAVFGVSYQAITAVIKGRKA